MFQKIGDIALFILSGDLDEYYGRQLIKSLASLIQQGWVKIVLDFKLVGHIHYKIMTEIVSLMVASHTMNGEIKVANLTPYHRTILQAAGLEEFFENYDTFAEAVLNFEGDVGTPAGPC